MTVWRTLALCTLILLAAVGLTVIIFYTEPEPGRVAATRESAMLVEVTTADRGTYQPTIIAMGTVEPARDIVLSPRVSGQVVSRTPAFAPGGFVREGESLLQIDRADYLNRRRQRQSELDQALAELDIEQGQQHWARQGYEFLEQRLGNENKALVLREPQMDAVRARIESARAALDQANLDLERTTIKAPFDAHILRRNVNVGSQVAPGDNLGRLVGLEKYWVAVTVAMDKLRRLSFPDSGETGATVQVTNSTAWEPGSFREGFLYRLAGTLEETSRMARVLVEVPDPLGYYTDDRTLPRLVIGSFVEVSIPADPLDNVVRLNRDHLRKGDTVWVKDEDRLNIRKVDIAFRDRHYAYISDGLDDGAEVVTTNLATVAEGARLRVAGETRPAPAADESTPGSQ